MNQSLGVIDVINAIASGSWTVLVMVLGVVFGIAGAKRKHTWLVLLGLAAFGVAAGVFLYTLFSGGRTAP